MSEHKANVSYLKITVPNESDNQRIRKYLLQHHRDFFSSKENLHRSFVRKEISVNGVVFEETQFIKAGDIIEIKYDKHLEEARKIEAIPIRICYEDEHLAIVWKPSGLNPVMFEKAVRYNIANRGSIEEKLYPINDIQKAASGLIVVTKNENAKQHMLQLYNKGEIDIVMRVLCHGFVEDTDISVFFRSAEPDSVVPGKVIRSMTIVSQTPSNNSGYISSLDLSLHAPLNSVNLRRAFYSQSNHPIIGNSQFTCPLKVNSDKGLCMSLITISFMHPILNLPITITQPEPSKFKVICDREERFFNKKKEKQIEQLKEAGINPDLLTENQVASYVLCQKEFCGHIFKISKDCLIPRRSSETLVLATVDAIGPHKRDAKILDVGTGCGNLLISILKKLSPSATGIGIDINEAALKIAAENSSKLLSNNNCDRVKWLAQDINALSLPQFEEAFDVLVCNPPYLDQAKVSKTKRELNTFEQEPPEALFADQNGYEWYYTLKDVAAKFLRQDGFVVLECGRGMMQRVRDVWCDDGWCQYLVCKDNQGWDRCLVLRRVVS
ncbi:S-adenosyl-L-methionine-dependent methyltransferase [Blakeslea trispora]|nr:S-adenosyl-L-methionine-dependent methyltransferase [Blakeslea trispora]